MADLIIRGALRDAATGNRVAGLEVDALATSPPQARAFASQTSNADGVFEITVPERTVATLIKGQAQVFFQVKRGDAVVADTRTTVLWDPNKPSGVVIPVPSTPVPDPTPTPGGPSTVDGRVVTERGNAAAGLRVEIWDHQLRGAQRIAFGQTDTDGHYTVGYEPAKLVGKQLADIEVVVRQGDGRAKVLANSKVTYQAPPALTVDLVVPFDAVTRTDEHARLGEAVQPLLGDVAATDVDARGVVYLANRGGFDPRPIAMSVQAERASAATQMPAAHYYALFRTGAATDQTTAHQLTDERFVSGIQQAIDSGLISDEFPIDASLEIHRAQARTAMRSFQSPGAVSPLADMLSIRLDDAGTDRFIDALRSTAGDPTALWSNLAQAGFSADQITQLQTDGQLGHLTRQNAPVMRRLVQDLQISSAEDLTRRGLYEPEAWTDVIGTDVPADLTAGTYAAGLALQVRLTQPTLVTADLVRRQKLVIGDQAASSMSADFLDAGAAEHRIGLQPVSTWSGFTELDAATRDSLLRVERIYQISPSDDSMATLAARGLDSATAVTRYSESDFLAAHGGAFPSAREATMVFRKAQQVGGTVLNLAVDYLNLRRGPYVGVLNGLDLGGPVLTDGTPAKATLETLFGNLDFCACEDCKSVLSPAAYMVDLLEMIDLSDVPHELDDPQVVLFDRRPDLPHLLLTCENTNVAMAYIDLVNEVLEFYVANGSLTGFTGHDTAPDATTADLLVDPPFIEDAAYTPLESAVFPVPLPFHRPLETLRLDFQAWNTTLTDALALFGTPLQTRNERLGLNPAEVSILTDSTFRQLPEHFGEPAGDTIDQLNAAIANAKVFCRRLGLAYMDLDAILQASFVNPGSVLVSLLQQLEIGLDVIESWSLGNISDADLTSQFPADLDPAPFGGDVLAWLTTNHDLIMGMIVLEPIAGADPELDDCDFASLELRLALPDPGPNHLTESEYTKLYRFIRLWHRLGGTVEEVDELLAPFLPSLGPQPALTALDDAVTTALAGVANFRTLVAERAIADRAVPDWLGLFDQAVPVDQRRDQLTRLMRMGDGDMTTLMALTGVDPLTADMSSDEPSLLRFVRARAAIGSGPLKIADLDWLVRHVDPTGELTPGPEALATERRALRDALAAVDTMLGNANTSDLSATQDAMVLVYDPAVAGRFFGLLGGSTTYAVPFATDEEGIPAPIAAADPAIGIDPFKKQLTHVGILSVASKAALDAAATALTLADMSEVDTAADLAAYVAAFTAATDQLRTAGTDDRDQFATDYPELGSVLDAAIAETDPVARAAIVRAGVLPELRGRLQATAVQTALATILGADDTIVAALTSDRTVLHAEGIPGAGIIDDLVALTAPIDLDQNQVIDLYLDPMVSDDHILYVQAPVATVVQLDADGDTVIPSGSIGNTGEAASTTPLPLVVGTPVHLTLTVSSLPAGGTVTLAWRTKGMARSPIPADRLTTSAASATAGDSLIRLHKSARLTSALAMTPAEIEFLAGVAPDTSGFLVDLPIDTSIAPIDVVALFERLELLIWFAAFRADTESEPDTWVGLLSSSALGAPAGQATAATVGGWKPADVAHAVSFVAPLAVDLEAVTTLRSMRPILDLAVQANQAAADLHSWANPDPAAADVEALEAKVKAVTDPASWGQLMQSAHDELRNLRRDALVAWILTFAPPTPDISDADELYEYFLVDVEMDACMQTSRIRLALSTIQLFITRCLMGLELRVAPSSISAAHWQWMRRYRVWEANRQIFLYPENWLEPELRDGKSSFFSELEGDLLKSDITDELAEDAYLAYLKKLDDVARLEIAGMYLEQGQPGDPDDDILHLFGRTNGRSREYWYRRFEYGYWTPWEKVGLNIESDTVIPVIWRNQLYLFWVSTLVKPRKGNQDSDTSDMADQKWQPPSPIDVEVTLSWGEYFNGAWVSPKSTNMRIPLVIPGLSEFHPEALLLAARPAPDDNVAERLAMAVIYYYQHDVKAFRVTFTSKNSEPLVVEDSNDSTLLTDVLRFNQHLFWNNNQAALYDNGLAVPATSLVERIAQPSNATTTDVDETLLTRALAFPGWPMFDVRTAMHPVENQWEAPFAYADDHSTFMVQPDEQVTSYLDYYDYVPVPVGPVVIQIPPLIEQVAIPNPLDPVWDPPWKPLVNENLKNVIGDTGSFELDGVTFDALGLMG